MLTLFEFDDETGNVGNYDAAGVVAIAAFAMHGLQVDGVNHLVPVDYNNPPPAIAVVGDLGQPANFPDWRPPAETCNRIYAEHRAKRIDVGRAVFMILRGEICEKIGN